MVANRKSKSRILSHVHVSEFVATMDLDRVRSNFVSSINGRFVLIHRMNRLRKHSCAIHQFFELKHLRHISNKKSSNLLERFCEQGTWLIPTAHSQITLHTLCVCFASSAKLMNAPVFELKNRDKWKSSHYLSIVLWYFVWKTAYVVR